MTPRRPFLYCALLVCACTSDSASRTEQASTRLDARDTPAVRPTPDSVTGAGDMLPSRDSLVQRLYDYGLAFGATRAALAASLGAPARVERRTIQNRYTPTTDTVFTLSYSGLRFHLLYVTADGREFLGAIELTGAERELPAGIRCQATTGTMLQRLLGQPHHTAVLGDTAVFSYPRPNPDAEEFVQFYAVRDTVRKVRWELYVD